MNRKGFAPIVILAIIAILAIASVGGYFIWKNSMQMQVTQSSSQPSLMATPTTTYMPTSTAITQNSSSTSTANNSSTQIVSVDNQYGLFTDTASDVARGYAPTVQYIDAGTIATGTYAGYHRIVAAVQFQDPGGPDLYFFATKDYKTFIIDSGTSDFQDSTDNLYNKNKIVGMGSVAVNAPDTITSGDFVLGFSYIDLSPTLGASLGTDVSGFKLYADSEVDSYYIASSSAVAPYIAGTSEIYAVDPASGLAFRYTLLSKEEYNRVGTTSTYPEDPNFFDKNEIDSTTSLYQSYGQLFPGNCGAAVSTYILKNISPSDLTKIGTSVGGVDLYILKNSTHPIDENQYATKITAWADSFVGINNVPAPSYQDYMAKNPVLIFQDAWSRWLGLGEWQYETGGGCGKPVIYLYPPKTTDVTIEFANPMRFTIDIPAYANGWRVEANPDGTLHDLQPQFTNCDAIDPTLFGSEYAKNACENNTYPYLYWTGRTLADYPSANNTGWIVPQNQVASFLDDKLAQIGLTDKETQDMTSYWVPEMLAKNVPFYRISFFQTAAMNQFIPMNISPKPDTIIRVFLDWSPLTSMPAVQPKPEILDHIDRTGFTLVEWGGLKQ